MWEIFNGITVPMAPDGGGNSGGGGNNSGGGDGGSASASGGGDGGNAAGSTGDGGSGDGAGSPPTMDFGNQGSGEGNQGSQNQGQNQGQQGNQGQPVTDGNQGQQGNQGEGNQGQQGYQTKAAEMQGEGEPTQILSELSDTANQPPQHGEQNQQNQQQQQQDLILGRFENQEALESSWKELNDIVRGRVNEMPDAEILAIAQDRNLVSADNQVIAAPQAPENYDFNQAVGEDTPFEWTSREEAPEAYDTITQELQAANITQEQLNGLMPIVQELVQQSVETFGAHVDINAEKAKLSEVWGRDTGARGLAVKNYVIANLGADVFYKPLGSTKIGMELLHKIMTQETGGGGNNAIVPAAGEDTRAASPVNNLEGIKSQLTELMKNPAYSDQMHPDHVQIHQEYRRLTQKKLELREKMEPY